MRLNPKKCVFGVKGGKFLGFMLTHRGIHVNLDKCQAIVEIKSPQNVIEAKRLASMKAFLSRFLPRIAERVRPIMNLLKKTNNFVWDDEYKESFRHLKETLATPLILSKPNINKKLIVYLLVLGEPISVVLV